jgi:hypothetical protein
VRLWDVESCKEVCRFFGHTNWVWGVAVSSDGRLGLSGSLDKTVRLWKLPVAQRPAKADDGNKKNDDKAAKDGTEKKLDEGKNPKTGGTTGGKAGKDKRKVLTPEEAIKLMPKENVTVQFKVASVQRPNPNYRGYLYLVNYIQLRDGGKFMAVLLDNARLPVDFERKMVRVTGRVEPAGATLFRMVVRDAKNIEVVKE